MTTTKKQEQLEGLINSITSDRIRASSTTLELLTGSTGVSIESIMVNQARLSAAVQLGNTPTMKFGGELNKYVQLVTMFRNTFHNTNKDPSALYKLHERHVF